MDDDKRNDQDPIDNDNLNEDSKEETEIIEKEETEEEPATEEKNEIEVHSEEEEPKKPVSEILYETGKQVGHVSLNYFKHIASFMKDHVGAIQHIFGYSFKTHILISVLKE